MTVSQIANTRERYAHLSRANLLTFGLLRWIQFFSFVQEFFRLFDLGFTKCLHSDRYTTFRFVTITFHFYLDLGFFLVRAPTKSDDRNATSKVTKNKLHDIITELYTQNKGACVCVCVCDANCSCQPIPECRHNVCFSMTIRNQNLQFCKR